VRYTSKLSLRNDSMSGSKSVSAEITWMRAVGSA